MEGIYRNFNQTNIVDNLGARDALLNTGIEVASFEASDYQKVRDSMMKLK